MAAKEVNESNNTTNTTEEKESIFTAVKETAKEGISKLAPVGKFMGKVALGTLTVIGTICLLGCICNSGNTEGAISDAADGVADTVKGAVENSKN